MAKLVRTNVSVTTPKEDDLEHKLPTMLDIFYTARFTQDKIISGSSPKNMLLQKIPFSIAVKLVANYISGDRNFKFFDNSVYERLHTALIESTIASINYCLNEVRHVYDKNVDGHSPKVKYLISLFFAENRHMKDDIITEWITHVIFPAMDNAMNSLDVKRTVNTVENNWVMAHFESDFVTNYRNFVFNEWVEDFKECMEHPKDIDFLTRYSMPQYVSEDRETAMFYNLFAKPMMSSLVYYNYHLILQAGFHEDIMKFLPVRSVHDTWTYDCKNSSVLYCTKYEKFIDGKNLSDRSKDCMSFVIIAKGIDRECRFRVNLTDLMVVISEKYQDAEVENRVRAAFSKYTNDFIGLMTEVFATKEINHDY